MLIIMQLGSTNDADGKIDVDGEPRSRRSKQLYDEAVADGERCFILPSGGSDDNFNPTGVPHWSYVAEQLETLGVAREAVIQPGLAALHTVDEALMAREFAEGLLRSAAAQRLRLVVVTSEWHGARARHLFGVSFGVPPRRAHAAAPRAAPLLYALSSAQPTLTLRAELNLPRASSQVRTPSWRWACESRPCRPASVARCSPRASSTRSARCARCEPRPLARGRAS